MILYVSEKCEQSERFGMIKLNKIIWRADFMAFAGRRIPITGCSYQKLRLGPAPVEMRPVLEQMRSKGHIEIDSVDFGNNRVEKRVIAVTPPNVRYFSADDLEYVDSAIAYYWDKTGTEASDDSHGIGWSTREDGDLMPYELVFLSDEKLNESQTAKFASMGRERSWKSR